MIRLLGILGGSARRIHVIGIGEGGDIDRRYTDILAVNKSNAKTYPVDIPWRH